MIYLKKISALLLLMLLSSSQIWAQAALFNGKVLSNNGDIPAVYYPVFFMVNHDSLSGIEVVTDENGFYYNEIQLNPGDEVEVKVFDCEGFEHTAIFSSPDSVNVANFFICLNDGNCQALFMAEQDSSNPFAIRFYNLSVGNYNNLSWVFGDGTPPVSQENPYHTFAQEGIYYVSLMIYDSLNQNGCFDVYTEPVFVGAPPECTAGFTYSLDTLNNTPMVYHFKSNGGENSLFYYWEFGDDSFSKEKNPEHIYKTGGTYEVYLMVKDTLTGCFADTVQYITTPNYYDFGGQAFLGEFPINIDPNDNANSATAYLYRKVKNRWYYMDQRLFWQLGYYWFTNKLEGDYLIRVDLDKNSEASDRYAPGYFKHAARWEQASTFSLADNVYEESVNLTELTALEPGINSISGYVNFDSTYNNTRQTMTGVLVQLYNQNNDLVKYCYSDDSGNYSFDNLPDGSYTLRGEFPGICSNQPEVLLSSSNNTVKEEEITLYNCSAVGINENKAFSASVIIAAFPVPANRVLNLEITSDHKDKVLITMVGMDGKKILERTTTLSGNNLISLNTSTLPNGIYMVNVLSSSNKKIIGKKIIIYH